MRRSLRCFFAAFFDIRVLMYKARASIMRIILLWPRLVFGPRSESKLELLISPSRLPLTVKHDEVGH